MKTFLLALLLFLSNALATRHKMNLDSYSTILSQVDQPISSQIIQQQPSIENKRYEFISGCKEITSNALGSFVSGAVLGYVIGLGMGVVKKDASTATNNIIKRMNTSGKVTALNWGSLTACFSTFDCASKVIRGRNDRWNQIIGSSCTGAFLSRSKGVSAMANGFASYGAFAYILDKLVINADNKSPLETKPLGIEPKSKI
mmetsp:Transcript_19759/g.27850  ORF Transcript_19759/g.27850 Transcript_19759/m.27850 type:complete len:201 (+) Transcript_19759:44-646(+)